MEQLFTPTDSMSLPSDAQIAGMSEDEYQEWVCQRENARRVLRRQNYGIDCPVCGNKGIVFAWDRKLQTRVTRTCECVQMRDTMRRMEESGVCDDWQSKTFEAFRAKEGWQAKLKTRIRQYADDPDRDWLLVTGQSGCGKTHLCTAAFAQLVRFGFPGQYVCWLDLMQKLDALYYNSEKFDIAVRPLMTCRLLYLDDLFKTRGGAEVGNRAFDNALRILDARYKSPNLLTILSTEWTLDQIVRMDEALGGRIRERCGSYIVQIEKKDGRNYRLRKRGSNG